MAAKTEADATAAAEKEAVAAAKAGGLLTLNQYSTDVGFRGKPSLRVRFAEGKSCGHVRSRVECV
jgi:hypothetical protein